MCQVFPEKSSLISTKGVVSLLSAFSTFYLVAPAADAAQQPQVPEERPTAHEGQSPSRHRFSLVFSPIRLGFVYVWLAGEFAITPRWSLAANGEVKFLSNDSGPAGSWSAGLDGR